MQQGINLLLETIKVPIKAKDFITYTFKSIGDALTNIEISTKKIIKNVVISVNIKRNNYSLNFARCVEYHKTVYGYKLTDCNDFDHIVLLFGSININIEFETSSNMEVIWLKYDRCIYDTSLRQNTFKYLHKKKYHNKVFHNIDECNQ